MLIMYKKEEIMENMNRALEVCENEEERRIARRITTMSMDTWLWWQDLGSQIPFLLFVFIGSTIFRNHWVIKILIIAYVIYGCKLHADREYYFNNIYPRIGREFRKKKGIE